MNTFRERLIWARAQKSERDRAEFTQEDLATKVGVTQGNIAHLESGRSKTSRNLIQIAETLGVNATWLASGKGLPFGMKPTQTVQPQEAKPARMVPVFEDEEELLELYRNSDERGKLNVLNMARREGGNLASSSNEAQPTG